MAEAIVGDMDQSVNTRVTVETVDARIARLHADNSDLHARVDGVEAKTRAEVIRAVLIAVGVTIAANALTMTTLGIILTHDAGM